MEKLKNLELNIATCKKLPDIAVMLGFDFKCSNVAIHKLKDMFLFDTLECNKVYEDYEQSSLAYALYSTIKTKMTGSVLELSRSRVSRIDCGSREGKFMISWNTQGSISMLRKTLSLSFSVINPHKLFTKYSDNCKKLGVKPDRETFNYIANSFADVIKKKIKILVVGRIKVDSSKIKDMLQQVEKKLPKLSNEKGTKPEIHEKITYTYPSLKISGIDSAVIEDYIRNNGMSTVAVDNHIVVCNNTFNTKRKTLKDTDRIKKFIQQKYEKLGDDFSCIFAYLCISQIYCTCCTIASIINTKQNPSSYIKLIQDVL